ncbi:hypothetical protein ACFL1H_00160 [Nanoarchaeota archaeon]
MRRNKKGIFGTMTLIVLSTLVIFFLLTMAYVVIKVGKDNREIYLEFAEAELDTEVFMVNFLRTPVGDYMDVGEFLLRRCALNDKTELESYKDIIDNIMDSYTSLNEFEYECTTKKDFTTSTTTMNPDTASSSTKTTTKSYGKYTHSGDKCDDDKKIRKSIDVPYFDGTKMTMSFVFCESTGEIDLIKFNDAIKEAVVKLES